MEFGWINVFGAVIVLLMMIPNIIYAIKNKDAKNLCANRFMNTIEQIEFFVLGSLLTKAQG